MDRKFLLALWGVLFAVCAAMGFVPQPQGVLRVLLAVLGLVFFAPPVLLLHRAKAASDCSAALLVRNIAVASLALTLVLLVANVLSLQGSVALGNVLHVVLVLVSAPMLCAQIWIVPLFCWAFLMIAAAKLAKQMKKTQT